MEIRMIHNGRDRDSLLTPMDARTVDLMLQYSIQLVRCESTMTFNVAGTRCTGDGILRDEFGRFHLDPWTNAEWIAFRDNFVTITRRYWDGKFELSPNHAWYLPRGTAGAPEMARISCGLSLGLVDSAAAANHRYFIIKPRETTFRSFASRGRRLGLFTHRDLAHDWVTRQTRVGGVRHSVSFLQSTVLHEFGHTLGLHHVNGRGNTDAHYGRTLEQRHDVMGMGDHAGARAAQPWITQLSNHLIPRTREDRLLRFTARVIAPQLITYWNNDWVPPPAAGPAPAAP